MKQIKELPQLTSASNDDVIPIQTTERTYKITKGNLLEGLSSGGGGGILPTNFIHWHDESVVVSGNPIKADIQLSYLYGVEIYQNPPAINDSFKFSRILQSGNYRLGILTARNSNVGTLKLEINNVLAFDDLVCYSASQNLNSYLYRDVVIASSGIQEFKFTVYSKHPSSNQYYFSGRKFWGYKL